ncbi:uncharacterized protein LOC119832993 [Zerene cesonia]|uniref:uncharacterized protein LOC119832993 n=1 Tax=Zerene cesonia TaxID=33412 RepID=UPI0018E5A2E5|nr:uncharacterized protein LOC119832993 [Zerene cesonia]
MRRAICVPFHVLFILSGIILVTISNLVGCNPITNSNFNEHVREFSLKEDEINSTNVKTLLKDGIGRNTNFGPAHNLVRFKDSPDNEVSSSDYSRGFPHEHQGYRSRDYEEIPYYGYEHEYHLPSYDHSFHHGLDHHHVHEPHHLEHHRHYNHALAAKAVLWPIAGIALLGAAAALVSNPILLQLGVATGKRRKRETEEITGPDLVLPWSEDDTQSKAERKNKCYDLMQLLNNKNKLLSNKRRSTFDDNTKSMSNEQIDKNYIKIQTENTDD